MRILITGAAGQLGRELTLLLGTAGEELITIDREELDFSLPERVAGYVSQLRADWVINCAAYTQVDKAEQEHELAALVNRESARAVAEGVRDSGGRLLHISTDYIFDGRHATAYLETDPPNPQSIYGRTKWEGERAVLQALPEALILRTSWVYGIHGNNFVKTMLRLAAEREQLSVVDDQIGTPSWTYDIAVAISTLIAAEHSGTYHFTNEGVASWYDFASEIISTARELGYPVKVKRLRPIPSSAYPTPATRPHFSLLDKRKIREVLGYDIPHWRESLQLMLTANHSGLEKDLSEL